MYCTTVVNESTKGHRSALRYELGLEGADAARAERAEMLTPPQPEVR